MTTTPIPCEICCRLPKQGRPATQYDAETGDPVCDECAAFMVGAQAQLWKAGIRKCVRMRNRK